ncbi:MAG: disulfide bond formation protein B [Pseudomonadota bacterium]|nr:disulfide bond formation protein B [Pseudomonadota bacterium]
MDNTITKNLSSLVHSPWYWLIYIVGGVTLLVIALVHQYVFDELPCVMCIQVRLWISLFVIVSFLGLLTRHNRVMNSIAHLSIVVIAVGLVERSYLLLGTERGFVVGNCNFDLGLPAWFAIEKWLPWLYRVETTCGYTPEVLFGITMAEGLMALSVCLLLVSLCAVLVSFVTPEIVE